MPIQHVSKMTRPDTSVAFWHFSDETKAYIQRTYIATKKILSATTENSEDMLSRRRTTVFSSVEALDAFQNDPNIKPYLDERRTYVKEHNHTLDKTIHIV